MRFLHVGDLLLGQGVHGVDLTAHQIEVLGQLVDRAGELRPDVVLFPGGLGPWTPPPAGGAAAVEDVLVEIVLGLGIPAVVLAPPGAPRPALGQAVLERAGLHVRHPGDDPRVPVELDGGTVDLLALHPEPGSDLDEALAALRARSSDGARTVVLTRLAVGAAGEDGADVSEARLRGLAYVALAGSACRRVIRPGRIEDPGPPHPVRLNAEEPAGVQLVELEPDGCRVERVALRPRRRLRTARGPLAELAGTGPSQDHVAAVVDDAVPLLRSVERLREAFPHVLDVERPRPAAAVSRVAVLETLFEEFLKLSGQGPPDGEAKDLVRAAARSAAGISA